MKTNNKLNKIRSKAKDVCVWIVIGLVIGCIVGWSTHTAIYNITHKEPEVSVGYVTGKLENIGELATQKLTYSGKVPLEEGSIPFITKKGFVMEYNAKIILLIGLIIYWISPIDLMPGNPIDDLILTIAYALANRTVLG